MNIRYFCITSLLKHNHRTLCEDSCTICIMRPSVCSKLLPMKHARIDSSFFPTSYELMNIFLNCCIGLGCEMNVFSLGVSHQMCTININGKSCMNIKDKFWPLLKVMLDFDRVIEAPTPTTIMPVTGFATELLSILIVLSDASTEGLITSFKDMKHKLYHMTVTSTFFTLSWNFFLSWVCYYIFIPLFLLLHI